MATITLTKDNFDDIIQQNELVFIDFWAEWCPPCKAFGPVFEAASEKYADVVFGKVDVDAQPELASRFGVRSIPTISAYKNQESVHSKPGALTAAKFDELVVSLKG